MTIQSVFTEANNLGVDVLLEQTLQKMGEALENVIYCDMDLRVVSKMLSFTNIDRIDWEACDSGIKPYIYCWTNAEIHFQDGSSCYADEVSLDMIKVNDANEASAEFIFNFFKKDFLKDMPVYGKEGSVCVDDYGIKVNSGLKEFGNYSFQVFSVLKAYSLNK